MAGGSAARSSTRWPQTTSPPWATRSPTRASVIAWAPPAGNGQPTRCPTAPMATPNAVVKGRSSGRTAWAASPAKRPAPASVRNRARATLVAGRMPVRPKRARATGCRGIDSGDSRSSTNGVPTDVNGATSRRHAAPSAPSPSAVTSTDRCSTAASPANGWARGTSGWIHRSPWASSGSARSAGEATANGMDRRSRRRGGTPVPSARPCGNRLPAWPRPPGRAPAGRREPASIAATSPLGPAPTTIASCSRRRASRQL